MMAGVQAAAAAHTSKKTSASSHSSTKSHGKKSKPRRTRVRGQKNIDSTRTRQIQQALVREHYLNSEPSGIMDARTEEGLRRYQSDHGWQSKVVPDSRALIQLGLGPSQEKLINPESAMTTHPANRPAAHTADHSSETITGKDTQSETPQK